MDQKLRDRLIKIDKQIEKLYEAEMNYLSLDASKDHMQAALTMGANGASEAAKKTAALATEQWLTFKKGLAVAEAGFHREKHKLELLTKAYDAEHLSIKVEAPVIKRQL